MNAAVPLTAIQEARKLRAEDLNARAAEAKAYDQTLVATSSIKAIPQLWEDDALCIVHALRLAIEKNSNNHLEVWVRVLELLTDAQDILQAEIEERDQYEQSLVRAAGQCS